MTHENFPLNDAPETAPTETAPTETAKEKFERERLTRRQALKKFGMTSAMATFALFSVDDLARMVGGAMERQARNSKIAAQVAQEFQHSGIALGADMPSPYYSAPPPYYYDSGSPAGNSGRTIGATCANTPGVFPYGQPRGCLDCLRAGCTAAYPNIFGPIVSQSYTVCVGAGNPCCNGSC